MTTRTARLGHFTAVTAGERVAVYSLKSNGDRELVAAARFVGGLLNVQTDRLPLLVNAGLSRILLGA